MLEENKRLYGVYTQDNQGNRIIYEKYEEDIVKGLKVFLEEDLKINFKFSKDGSTFFEIEDRMYYFQDAEGKYIVGEVNGVSYAHIPYLDYEEEEVKDYLSPATMSYRIASAIYNKNDFIISALDWDNKYGHFQSSVIIKLKEGAYSEKIIRESRKKNC